jgi:hypothetical protein
MEADAEAVGAVKQDLVENGAAEASSGTSGKRGLGGEGIGTGLIADETDAA